MIEKTSRIQEGTMAYFFYYLFGVLFDSFLFVLLLLCMEDE